MFTVLRSYNLSHRFIGKKSVDTDYSALTEEKVTNPISPKFRVGDKFRITSYKKLLAKVTLKVSQKKYL